MLTGDGRTSNDFGAQALGDTVAIGYARYTNLRIRETLEQLAVAPAGLLLSWLLGSLMASAPVLESVCVHHGSRMHMHTQTASFNKAASQSQSVRRTMAAGCTCTHKPLSIRSSCCMQFLIELGQTKGARTFWGAAFGAARGSLGATGRLTPVFYRLFQVGRDEAGASRCNAAQPLPRQPWTAIPLHAHTSPVTRVQSHESHESSHKSPVTRVGSEFRSERMLREWGCLGATASEPLRHSASTPTIM